MRSLIFRHPDVEAMGAVLHCFPSLGSGHWHNPLFYAALAVLKMDVDAEAVRHEWELVCSLAVPVELDPHPKRAVVDHATKGLVGVRTPGDVCLLMSYDPDGQGGVHDAFCNENPWRMHINFNRDSRRLASIILCRLMMLDEKTEMMPTCTETEHLTPLCLLLSGLCIRTISKKLDVISKEPCSPLPNGL